MKRIIGVILAVGILAVGLVGVGLRRTRNHNCEVNSLTATG